MKCKSKPIFILILLLILSCSNEDESPETPGLDRIEIRSFTILDNSTGGLTVEARLLFETEAQIQIADHGVQLLKNNSPYDKISLGVLEEDAFSATVVSGIENGETYAIFPFIFTKNTFFMETP